MQRRVLDSSSRLTAGRTFPSISALLSVSVCANSATSGSFIAEQRNAVLVGGTGTGKSHLAIGIARACIRGGARGRFFNVVALVNRLENEARQGRQGLHGRLSHPRHQALGRNPGSVGLRTNPPSRRTFHNLEPACVASCRDVHMDVHFAVCSHRSTPSLASELLGTFTSSAARGERRSAYRDLTFQKPHSPQRPLRRSRGTALLQPVDFGLQRKPMAWAKSSVLPIATACRSGSMPMGSPIG